MLEKEIEKYLVKSCADHGWLCIKHGQNGVPDRIIVTTSGVVFWAELKAEGGRPSALQKKYISELQARGQKAGFVYGLSGVKNLIFELENAEA